MSSEGQLFVEGLCWPSRLATCLGNRSLHWDGSISQLEVDSSEPKELVLKKQLTPVSASSGMSFWPMLSRCLCNQPDNTGLLHPAALDHLWFASAAMAAAEESYSPGVRTFGSFCLVSLKSFPRHLPSAVTAQPHIQPMPGPVSLNQSPNLGGLSIPLGKV